MNTKIQIDTAEMAKYVELADIVPAKKDLLSVISEAHAAQMSLGSDTHMVATMPDEANPAHKEPCDRAYDAIVTDLKLMKSDSTQVAQILSSFHHYTRPFVPVMMCTDGKPLKVIGGGAENLHRGLHIVLAGAFWEMMQHDAAMEVSKSSMSKVRAAATDARPLTQEYVKAFRGAVARDEAGPPANPVSTTCIDSIQWKALLKAQGAIRLAVTGTTTGSLAEEPEELDRQVVRYKAQISAQGWSTQSAVSTRLFWDLMTGAQQELVSGCAVYDVVNNERWLLNGCSTEPMASHTGFVGALIEAYGGPVSGIYLNDATAVVYRQVDGTEKLLAFIQRVYKEFQRLSYGPLEKWHPTNQELFALRILEGLSSYDRNHPAIAGSLSKTAITSRTWAQLQAYARDLDIRVGARDARRSGQPAVLPVTADFGHM